MLTIKKLYHAIAVCNFKANDIKTFRNLVIDEIKNEGIANAISSKDKESFRDFVGDYKIMQSSEFENEDLDWSFFDPSKFIISEPVLETMAFDAHGDAIGVDIVKLAKPTGAIIFKVCCICR